MLREHSQQRKDSFFLNITAFLDLAELKPLSMACTAIPQRFGDLRRRQRGIKTVPNLRKLVFVHAPFSFWIP